MTNRLAAASSPYLLQHKDNPVHWYEWGEDAFAAARLLDRPVLLSVGYATCHWCHVMAHESFEDEATADYMNTHFVNIKVDREERPDIDRIYMDAVQAMTGHGGWPMTVFLTPQGEPFFAGTYFPKAARGHHPSFRAVMEAIVDAWMRRRVELDEQARRLTEAVRAHIPPAADSPDRAVVSAALHALQRGFDEEWGGFGGAPKFPQAPTLELLMRAAALRVGDEAGAARRMLAATLDAMDAGGIHDHLGGGFSRYSVDRRWLVPHFEKMLYDNALLARVYLRSWQLLDDLRYRDVAISTIEYMLRDLGDPGGGFHSGEDADSEGEEGAFYVWSWDELSDVLGPDLAPIAALLGASEGGNFEGSNVLHRPATVEEVAERFAIEPAELALRLATGIDLLRARRRQRVRPSVDDKVVTAWNGLALRTLAEAAAVLDEDRYLDAAVGLAEFTERELLRDGRLVRTWRAGTSGPHGFCDDYGAMAVGLLTLYQVAGDVRWFELGAHLVTTAMELFSDPAGGFFNTPHDGEDLIARPKNLMDNPTPSDNALMAEALQMLLSLTGEAEFERALTATFRAAGRLMDQYPTAVGHAIAVLATTLAEPKEIAIVGPDELRRPFDAVVWSAFRPDCHVASGKGPTHEVPLLRDRSAPSGAVLAYVCRSFVCDLPATTPDELTARL